MLVPVEFFKWLILCENLVVFECGLDIVETFQKSIETLCSILFVYRGSSFGFTIVQRTYKSKAPFLYF